MTRKYVLPSIPKYEKNRVIILPVKNIWKDSLKKYCRDLMKNSKNYVRKIKLDDETVCGKSKDGNTFKIKYFGWWVFGVPGFSGSLKFFNDSNNNICIKCPDEADSLVNTFVQELAKKLQENIKK